MMSSKTIGTCMVYFIIIVFASIASAAPAPQVEFDCKYVKRPSGVTIGMYECKAKCVLKFGSASTKIPWTICERSAPKLFPGSPNLETSRIKPGPIPVPVPVPY